MLPKQDFEKNFKFVTHLKHGLECRKFQPIMVPGLRVVTELITEVLFFADNGTWDSGDNNVSALCARSAWRTSVVR